MFILECLLFYLKNTGKIKKCEEKDFENYSISFNPLYLMDDKEVVEIQNKQMQTLIGYKNNGIMSVEEIRNILETNDMYNLNYCINNNVQINDNNIVEESNDKDAIKTNKTTNTNKKNKKNNKKNYLNRSLRES